MSTLLLPILFRNDSAFSMTQKRLLSISAIARYLGVSIPTARRLVRSQGFPKPVSIGPDPDGKVLDDRWSVDSIDAWLMVTN